MKEIIKNHLVNEGYTTLEAEEFLNDIPPGEVVQTTLSNWSD